MGKKSLIQIYTTQDCSTDLKSHLTDTPIRQAAMQWYAHRVTVLRRKCLILVEWRSRYAMVFTGMVKDDFAHFPAIFHDRLLREALSVCQLDEEKTDELEGLINIVCDEVQICPGSDRSVQAHINEIARDLKYLAAEIGFLPEDDRREFNFGLRVNQMLRKTKEDKEYFYPLEVYRDFWTDMLKHVNLPPTNVIPFPGVY